LKIDLKSKIVSGTEKLIRIDKIEPSDSGLCQISHLLTSTCSSVVSRASRTPTKVRYKLANWA
jgi:hypothetical protein